MYGGLNLEGMIDDVDHALWSEGFLVHRIEKTGDPQRMLEVTCAPDSVPVTQARAALEHAWIEEAAFRKEAHIVEEHANQLLLDFVTWWDQPDGPYVTGRVVADLTRSPSNDSHEGGDAIVH
jgi:hypothetical protein